MVSAALSVVRESATCAAAWSTVLEVQELSMFIGDCKWSRPSNPSCTLPLLSDTLLILTMMLCIVSSICRVGVSADTQCRAVLGCQAQIKEMSTTAYAPKPLL